MAAREYYATFQWSIYMCVNRLFARSNSYHKSRDTCKAEISKNNVGVAKEQSGQQLHRIAHI